jgi:hypothetical protein
MYLIDMLASFVRINSYTIPVRIRNGIWYKYRFSDFDIESLIEFHNTIDHADAFPLLKRLADLCLFLSGICPDTLLNSSWIFSAHSVQYRGRKRRSKKEIIELGKNTYHKASTHESAYQLNMEEVLDTISTNFELASKPLNLLAESFLSATSMNTYDEFH